MLTDDIKGVANHKNADIYLPCFFLSETFQGLTNSSCPFLFIAVFLTILNCFLLMPFNFSGLSV